MKPSCTCDIEMGKIVDHVNMINGKRPVREVKVTLCSACADYTAKRLDAIPSAERLANEAVPNRAKDFGVEARLKWNAVFHGSLAKQCRQGVVADEG